MSQSEGPSSRIITDIENRSYYEGKGFGGVATVEKLRELTRTVVTALIKQAKKLPKELYKSLTWDRGKELTDHRRFTLATKIDVYFCDPQSPWQRGSNENTNGLLRQYFHRSVDPRQDLDQILCWREQRQVSH